MLRGPEFPVSVVDVPAESPLPTDQDIIALVGVVLRVPPQAISSIHRVGAILLELKGSDRIAALESCEALEGHHLPVRRHVARSEEHTSELQSRSHLVCRLL